MRPRLLLSVSPIILEKIIRSYRISAIDDEYIRTCERPPIFALFHAFQMLAAAYETPFRTNILVSHSKDGEIAALTLERLGFGVVRGSSSKGGKEGLAELVGLVKKGESAAITVDGPRGPKEVVKSGIIRLSLSSGVPIVCVSAISSPMYRLKGSWDNFIIAPPFSRVFIRFSSPIVIEGEGSSENIAKYKSLIEDTLKGLFESVKIIASKGRTVYSNKV